MTRWARVLAVFGYRTGGRVLPSAGPNERAPGQHIEAMRAALADPPVYEIVVEHGPELTQIRIGDRVYPLKRRHP